MGIVDLLMEEYALTYVVIKCHTMLNEISQPSRKIVVTFVNVLNDI